VGESESYFPEVVVFETHADRDHFLVSRERQLGRPFASRIPNRRPGLRRIAPDWTFAGPRVLRPVSLANPKFDVDDASAIM
jgi:hypothetical protein